MSARALDTDLRRARAAFAAWRSGRRGRSPIPDALWRIATTLLEHHELTTVARELGLNPTRLRARLTPRTPVTRRRSQNPAFVELRALDLVPAPSPVPDATVHARIERPDGTRLTLSLPVADAGLLEQLCAAFVRA